MKRSIWKPYYYHLKFRIGEFVLAQIALPVQRRIFSLDEIREGVTINHLPPLADRQQGFLILDIPESNTTAMLEASSTLIAYPLKTYHRCYIDMSEGFEAYKAKFSSKSRAGINRKVKKFSEESGGLDMRIYRRPEELDTFFSFAGKVSAESYQERLLDAGLPRSESDMQAAKNAANNDNIRAFLLFSHGKPVSYLYCPAENDILKYAYLGYVPEYAKLSPGTVLQWLALDALFFENRFRAFDFTDGDSDHKKFFSTHQVLCKQQLLLVPNLRNRCLIKLQMGINWISSLITETLEKLGLKQKIKRLIRRIA